MSKRYWRLFLWEKFFDSPFVMSCLLFVGLGLFMVFFFNLFLINKTMSYEAVNYGIISDTFLVPETKLYSNNGYLYPLSEPGVNMRARLFVRLEYIFNEKKHFKNIEVDIESFEKARQMIGHSYQMLNGKNINKKGE